MTLRQTQRRLSEQFFLAKAQNERLTLERFLRQHAGLTARYDSARAEIEAEDALSLASAEVLSRYLAQLSESLERTAYAEA